MNFASPQLLPFLLVLTGAFSLSRPAPPFPEEWKADPLRYPYAADESLYLGSGLHRSAETSPSRIFPLPPTGRGPIRVLLQTETGKWAVSAPSGADFEGFRLGGGVSREHFSAGAIRIELSPEKHPDAFRVAGPGEGAFSGRALGLRLIPGDSALPLELDGKAYRGNLEFYPDGAGGVQCVNVLSLEDYLRGVVPLEMGHRGADALEALKAQAVTARTYALKSMLARDSADFDIRGSVQDQVYGGVGAEDAAGSRAVRETEGRVLLYADTLALCYYHSTCGGFGAGRDQVWGGPAVPYLVAQPDLDADGKPWCRASHYMSWTESWSLAELTEILRHNLAGAGVPHVPSFGRARDFKVKSRFADGRINTLEVKTDRGSFELHGDKIRAALKTAQGKMLESDRFEISVEGDRVTARGSGFGHGIGMCQMGALGRSAAGQTYREILAAYYPGTVLALAK